MIEIPSDLHPSLTPLAFLLGTWQGAGVAEYPGQEACNVGQEISFTHDGRDFLEYTARSWQLDAAGDRVRPLESERGFWRAPGRGGGRDIEAVLVRDQGVAEVWYGALAAGKPQLDLVTDTVARTSSSPAYTGGKRLYGYVNGDLMWVGEKATPTVPLRPYMSAHLKRVVDPREWIKDIKDLPDDGIAFFR